MCVEGKEQPLKPALNGSNGYEDEVGGWQTTLLLPDLYTEHCQIQQISVLSQDG